MRVAAPGLPRFVELASGSVQYAVAQPSTTQQASHCHLVPLASPIPLPPPPPSPRTNLHRPRLF